MIPCVTVCSAVGELCRDDVCESLPCGWLGQRAGLFVCCIHVGRGAALGQRRFAPKSEINSVLANPRACLIQIGPQIRRTGTSMRTCSCQVATQMRSVPSLGTCRACMQTNLLALACLRLENTRDMMNVSANCVYRVRPVFWLVRLYVLSSVRSPGPKLGSLLLRRVHVARVAKCVTFDVAATSVASALGGALRAPWAQGLG